MANQPSKANAQSAAQVCTRLAQLNFLEDPSKEQKFPSRNHRKTPQPFGKGFFYSTTTIYLDNELIYILPPLKLSSGQQFLLCQSQLPPKVNSLRVGKEYFRTQLIIVLLLSFYQGQSPCPLLQGGLQDHESNYCYNKL